MFRGIEGRRNLIVALGVFLACIGVLLVFRTIMDKKAAELPQPGDLAETVLDINDVDIPEFDQSGGGAYSISLNEGKPFFTAEEIETAKSTGYFIELSTLDPAKRAQTATMCADEEHIRTEERNNDIYDLKPSGWKGNAIYQRSHILMWKLSGPDSLENLITGTEYFNQVEMYKYEKQVTGYLWDNPGNHVLYRVTPYYIGEELVARGVLMEAYSLEDNGALQFCEFVYNAQPGSEIVYETGVYHMYEKWQDAVDASVLDEYNKTSETQEIENLDAIK